MWVWVILLHKATHKELSADFAGNFITLKPGQLITGRKALAEISGVNEHKVDRILKRLESEHRIEQHTTPFNRLISIVNWEKYQGSEQPIEQQMSNERARVEQGLSTNKKRENVRIKESTPLTGGVGGETVSIPLVSDEIYALTDLFISNVVAIYPSATGRLKRDDQASHLQWLAEKRGMGIEDLTRIIKYLSWSHEKHKSDDRIFDWGINIRSTAKLRKSVKGDPITYAELILEQANTEAQKMHKGGNGSMIEADRIYLQQQEKKRG